MEGWRVRPLGDLIENLDARRLPVKESDRKPGPYPYYGASGIVDHVDDFIFDGLHLLVAEDGENLRTRKLPIAFLADGKFWVNNHAHIVRGNSEADTRFLMYALQVADIGSYLSGSTMPKLTQANLHRIPINAPNPALQREIAATLGALDDKIELNRRMNETLGAMARAIFCDWFIDFGPTRAKMLMRGEDPQKAAVAPAPYLAPDLWSLFPDRLDPTTGLPQGWSEGTLADVAELNPETWSAKNAPEQVHYVDLSNTKWGSIDAVERFGWDAAPSRARRVLRVGDTIVGCVRPGNGSFAYIDTDGLTGSTGFAALRPKQRRDAFLIWCASTSQENIERLSHLADGGAYPAVRPEVVAQSALVLASERVLQWFSDLAAPLVDRIARNNRESRTLAKTRDYLLPKLMSGEVRVRDAESMTGRAT